MLALPLWPLQWGGHTLELDETQYPWGTLYELECETVSEGVRGADDGHVQAGSLGEPAAVPLLAHASLPAFPQDEPERLRAALEQHLTELGVAYKYSTTSKFANFRNRTLE